jgi:hypothetical protein
LHGLKAVKDSKALPGVVHDDSEYREGAQCVELWLMIAQFSSDDSGVHSHRSYPEKNGTFEANEFLSLRFRPGRHRFEADRLPVCQRPHAGMAEDEEPAVSAYLTRMLSNADLPTSERIPSHNRSYDKSGRVFMCR